MPMPYRTAPQSEPGAPVRAGPARRALLLLAVLFGVNGVLAVCNLLTLRTFGLASVGRNPCPPGSVTVVDGRVLGLLLAFVNHTASVRIAAREVEAIGHPLLALATALAAVLLARALHGKTMRRAAWVAAAAYAVSGFGHVSLEAGGYDFRRRLELAVLVVVVASTLGLSALLLAAWRFARVLRTPTTGWVYLAVAAATLSQALEWPPTRSWLTNTVSTYSDLVAHVYHAVCSAAVAALVAGAFASLRTSIRVAPPSSPPTVLPAAPELSILVGTLRPLGAAIGAQVAVVVFDVVLSSVGDASPAFAIVPGALAASLVGSQLVVTGVLAVTFARFRRHFRGVALPLGAAVLLHTLAAAFLDANQLAPDFVGLGTAILPVAGCAWLLAADRAARVLDQAAHAARVPGKTPLVASLRPVLLALGLLALLYWCPGGAFRSVLAWSTAIIACRECRRFLATLTALESRADIALDREAAALAREVGSSA